MDPISEAIIHSVNSFLDHFNTNIERTDIPGACVTTQADPFGQAVIDSTNTLVNHFGYSVCPDQNEIPLIENN